MSTSHFAQSENRTPLSESYLKINNNSKSLSTIPE